MRFGLLALLLGLASCCGCPEVTPVVDVPLAAPASVPPVSAVALADAAGAQRAAERFETTSLKASRGELIDVMRLSQDLKVGVKKLRQNRSAGNAAAVRAAARALRAAARENGAARPAR